MYRSHWTGKRPIKGSIIYTFYSKDVAELEHKLPRLEDMMHQDGMIWVSWIKNASKVPTDINENIIRNNALSLKLVDVKVCSVND